MPTIEAATEFSVAAITVGLNIFYWDHEHIVHSDFVLLPYKTLKIQSHFGCCSAVAAAATNTNGAQHNSLKAANSKNSHGNSNCS